MFEGEGVSYWRDEYRDDKVILCTVFILLEVHFWILIRGCLFWYSKVRVLLKKKFVRISICFVKEICSLFLSLLGQWKLAEISILSQKYYKYKRFNLDESIIIRLDYIISIMLQKCINGTSPPIFYTFIFKL